MNSNNQRSRLAIMTVVFSLLGVAITLLGWRAFVRPVSSSVLFEMIEGMVVIGIGLFVAARALWDNQVRTVGRLIIATFCGVGGLVSGVASILHGLYPSDLSLDWAVADIIFGALWLFGICAWGFAKVSATRGRPAE